MRSKDMQRVLIERKDSINQLQASKSSVLMTCLVIF